MGRCKLDYEICEKIVQLVPEIRKIWQGIEENMGRREEKTITKAARYTIQKRQETHYDKRTTTWTETGFSEVFENIICNCENKLI